MEAEDEAAAKAAWWRLEVDAARLLARCQQMAADNPTMAGRAALKFEQMLAVAHTKLAELATVPKGVDKAVLSELQLRLQKLTDLADTEKMLAPVEPGQGQLWSMALPRPRQTAAAATAEQDVQTKVRKALERQQRESLLGPAASAPAAAAETTAVSKPKSRQSAHDAAAEARAARAALLGPGAHDAGAPAANDADSVKAVLEAHRKREDELVTTMAALATELRTNSVMFKSALAADAAIAETVDSTMSDNLARMQKEGARLKRLSESTWSGTLTLWLIFIFVSVAFVLTFLFIRLVPK